MSPAAEVLVTVQPTWGRRVVPVAPTTTYTRFFTFDVSDAFDNGGGGDDFAGLAFDFLFQGTEIEDYDTAVPMAITITDLWLLFDDTSTFGDIDGTGTIQFIINGVNQVTMEADYDIGTGLVHATGSLPIASGDLVLLQSVFGTATECPVLQGAIAYTRTE